MLSPRFPGGSLTCKRSIPHHDGDIGPRGLLRYLKTESIPVDDVEMQCLGPGKPCSARTTDVAKVIENPAHQSPGDQDRHSQGALLPEFDLVFGDDAEHFPQLRQSRIPRHRSQQSCSPFDFALGKPLIELPEQLLAIHRYQCHVPSSAMKFQRYMNQKNIHCIVTHGERRRKDFYLGFSGHLRYIFTIAAAAPCAPRDRRWGWAYAWL